MLKQYFGCVHTTLFFKNQTLKIIAQSEAVKYVTWTSIWAIISEHIVEVKMSSYPTRSQMHDGLKVYWPFKGLNVLDENEKIQMISLQMLPEYIHTYTTYTRVHCTYACTYIYIQGVPKYALEEFFDHKMTQRGLKRVHSMYILFHF